MSVAKPFKMLSMTFQLTNIKVMVSTGCILNSLHKLYYLHIYLISFHFIYGNIKVLLKSISDPTLNTCNFN